MCEFLLGPKLPSRVRRLHSAVQLRRPRRYLLWLVALEQLVLLGLVSVAEVLVASSFSDFD